jgi:transcriptional regulator with XRE-family HTH domain
VNLPVDKSITSQDYRVFLRELRAARRRGGLTQVDLASRLGETQSFISKCERGERRLDVLELRAFCRAFGLSLAEFVQHLDRVLAAEPASGRRRRPV